MENQELKDELIGLADYLEGVWGKVYKMGIKVDKADKTGKQGEMGRLAGDLVNCGGVINRVMVEIMKTCQPEVYAAACKRIADRQNQQ